MTAATCAACGASPAPLSKTTRCRACNALASRAYRLANPLHHKAYAAANQDRLRAYNRAYQRAYREWLRDGTAIPKQHAARRRCTACCKRLFLSAFDVRRPTHGDLQVRCRTCQAAYRSAYRKALRADPVYGASLRRAEQRYRARRRAAELKERPL